LLQSRSTLFPYTTLFRSGPQADHRLNIFAPRHGLLLPAIRPSVNENSALSGQRRKEEVTSRIVEKYGLEGGANDMKLLTFQTERSEEHTSELQSRENLVC